MRRNEVLLFSYISSVQLPLSQIRFYLYPKTCSASIQTDVQTDRRTDRQSDRQWMRHSKIESSSWNCQTNEIRQRLIQGLTNSIFLFFFPLLLMDFLTVDSFVTSSLSLLIEASYLSLSPQPTMTIVIFSIIIFWWRRNNDTDKKTHIHAYT